MPVTNEQLKDSSPKGFGDSKRQPADDGALVAHQQFELAGKAATDLANQRLQTLLGAVVQSRKPAVKVAADCLEAVSDGRVDVALLAEELEQRQRSKAMADKAFNASNFGGLTFDIPSGGNPAGFLTATVIKAIEGV